MSRRIQGYTLIELLLVIVILSIIAAATMSPLIEAFEAYIGGEGISIANWQGIVAQSRISREIHIINSPNAIDTSSTASLFKFTDIYGTTITYSVSGTTLQRTEGASAAQNLADGVSSLTFTYYDSTGTTVTPPLSSATAATIRYIQVSIVIVLNGVNYTATTTINARNLI